MTKRTQFKWFFVGLIVAAGVPALAATFNLFSPAAGILVGNPSTYVTTAATSSDIRALWSGTCSAATWLSGAGACSNTLSGLTPTFTIHDTTGGGADRVRVLSDGGVLIGNPTGGSQGGGTINATALYINGAPVGTSTGAVSSVGLAMPAAFTVTGSPVTAAGTLTASFATGQPANQVLATPNGSTGALGIRALVAADIPAISLTSGISGILPVANGGTGNSALAALTKTDDTNVTLTLGGSPTTALVNAASITAGWTGQLAVGRGGSGASTLTGYLKGNGTSAFTASATIPYSDITGTPTIPTGANPTASAGLTAVNGSATTFLRSDGAPAISQSIVPTWTGQHTWTQSLLVPDGTVTVPAVAFSANANTGFYRLAANDIGVATAGVLRADISSTFATFAVPVLVPDGTSSSLGLAFAGQSTTGLFRNGPGDMRFVSAGTTVMAAQATALNMAVPILSARVEGSNGSAGAPEFTFASDTSTGFYRAGTGDVHYSSSGTDQGSVCGSTGSACSRRAYGVLATSASACTLSSGSYDALNISSCTRISAGLYSVNFSWSAAIRPTCVATVADPSVNGVALINAGSGANNIQVRTVNLSGTATDLNGFTIHCFSN